MAVLSREEADRTLAGPTGGFLFVGGSGMIEDTGRVVTGSWFSSLTEGWTFSPERLRLEGEGLDDACGTGTKWRENISKDKPAAT